jgi:hypothetical protein
LRRKLRLRLCALRDESMAFDVRDRVCLLHLIYDPRVYGVMSGMGVVRLTIWTYSESKKMKRVDNTQALKNSRSSALSRYGKIKIPKEEVERLLSSYILQIELLSGCEG